MRNTIFIILITSFSILLTDAAFTYFYKLANGHLLLTTNKKHRKKSPLFHHTLSKCSYGLADQWGRSRSAFMTNSLGFRDQSNRNIELQHTADRIVIIGDSFTEGVGVTYENSFVGMVDNSKQINSQILNAAVASYSPIIYWRKVKHLIEDVQLKFDHLVVYIDISDIEDEAKNYKLSSSGSVIDKSAKDKKKHNITEPFHVDCDNYEPFSVKTFLWKYTTLSYFIYDYKRHIKQFEKVRKKREKSNIYRSTQTEERILKNVLNLDRANWTVADEIMQEYGEVGLENAKQYMNKLANLLKQHNIQLTVAVYPWPTQIWHNDIDSIQVKFWQSWANNNNAGFINHFPDFVNKGSDAEKTNFIKKHYIWGDAHFNKTGHQLIADKLLNYLSK